MKPTYRKPRIVEFAHIVLGNVPPRDCYSSHGGANGWPLHSWWNEDHTRVVCGNCGYEGQPGEGAEHLTFQEPPGHEYKSRWGLYHPSTSYFCDMGYDIYRAEAEFVRDKLHEQYADIQPDDFAEMIIRELPYGHYAKYSLVFTESFPVWTDD